MIGSVVIMKKNLESQKKKKGIMTFTKINKGINKEAGN